MNDIEEIKKLYAKDEEVNISDAKIKIMPLSIGQMSELENIDKGASPEEVANNAAKMFSMSLGIKEEEAKKLSFKYLEELMAGIMKVNNFKEKDLQKTGMQDFIKNQQKLIKEKKKNEQAESDPQQDNGKKE